MCLCMRIYVSVVETHIIYIYMCSQRPNSGMIHGYRLYDSTSRTKPDKLVGADQTCRWRSFSLYKDWKGALLLSSEHASISAINPHVEKQKAVLQSNAPRKTWTQRWMKNSWSSLDMVHVTSGSSHVACLEVNCFMLPKPGSKCISLGWVAMVKLVNEVKMSTPKSKKTTTSRCFPAKPKETCSTPGHFWWVAYAEFAQQVTARQKDAGFGIDPEVRGILLVADSASRRRFCGLAGWFRWILW